VLNRLPGRSTAARVIEARRQSVEAELLAFVGSLFSLLDLAAQGAREERLPEAGVDFVAISAKAQNTFRQE
jgi:hypothetical protein